MTTARDHTALVEQYVERLDPALASVVQALRSLIREAAPEAQEAFKWSQPVWELRGPVCAVKAHREHVTLVFWRGAELAGQADQHRLLEGKGAKMRHLRLTDAADIDAGQIGRLVRGAVELNRQLGNPTRGQTT